jgi:hypothetical protein
MERHVFRPIIRGKRLAKSSGSELGESLCIGWCAEPDHTRRYRRQNWLATGEITHVRRDISCDDIELGLT